MTHHIGKTMYLIIYENSISIFKCYKTQKFELYGIFNLFYISLYTKTNKITI